MRLSNEIDRTPEIMGRLAEIYMQDQAVAISILKLADDEQWLAAAKTILCMYNESFEKLDQFIKASLEP